MRKGRLTSWQKLGCGVALICIAAVPAWLLHTMSAVGHDKTLNSRLQLLWSKPGGVPLRIVVPPSTRWMENAFIAEASEEEVKPVAVLILDDHYRSGDYMLRSKSGVVGDEISREVLCSVPEQARSDKVRLDPVVQRLIAAECGDR